MSLDYDYFGICMRYISHYWFAWEYLYLFNVLFELKNIQNTPKSQKGI